MAQRYRPRKEFKFWLFYDLADEVRLMEYIAYLKKSRKFASYVRNGLRLMWSLGEGDTSVLFELFPGLKAQLQTPPPDDDKLQRKIEDLHRLILEQGRGITIEAPLVAAPALKPLAGLKPVAALPAPVEDDDDQDTVVLTKSTSTKGTANFISSFANNFGD